MENLKIEPIGVQIDHLSKLFLSQDKEEDFLAVNDVSLDVKPGTLVTLLGPSGCGKTTILRMLSGFTLPTKGRVLLGGVDMTNTPPNKRDVGMMFQSYALFPHLTVYDNVAYGLKIKKVSSQELKKRVNDVLELMQISDFKDRIPEQLSGGQQQRVALARAVVTAPKILLFDEPLSNLDAKMREYMREELRKIQQKLSITSVYVTHDQSEAMAISDKVVIMNHGRIEQVGTPQEIYIHPSNKFVANFMGKANFVDGIVRSKDGEKIKVEGLGSFLTIENNPSLNLNTSDHVFCMVRPESLKVDKNGKFQGKVHRATYFGTSVEYEVEICGEMLIMSEYQFLQNGIYHTGDNMPISIDESSIRILIS